MTITLAQNSDLDQIMELQLTQVEFHAKLDSVYYSSYDNKYTLENDRQYYTKALDSSDHQVIVARDDDRIIGFLEIEYKNDTVVDSNLNQYGEISNLFIDSKFRHQGIASALVRYAEKLIKARNLKTVKVQVSSFNDNALHLYRKLDYVDRQRFLYKTLSSPNFIQKAASFIQSIFRKK
jgi:ribosomal-protein-alanine N-acetyltransferase